MRGGRRGATDTCLDEVTPLGPTPEGRPIKAGIHPLHLCGELSTCRRPVAANATTTTTSAQTTSFQLPLTSDCTIFYQYNNSACKISTLDSDSKNHQKTTTPKPDWANGLFCRAEREQHLKISPPAGTRVRNEHGSPEGTGGRPPAQRPERCYASPAQRGPRREKTRRRELRSVIATSALNRGESIGQHGLAAG